MSVQKVFFVDLCFPQFRSTITRECYSLQSGHELGVRYYQNQFVPDIFGSRRSGLSCGHIKQPLWIVLARVVTGVDLQTINEKGDPNIGHRPE